MSVIAAALKHMLAAGMPHEAIVAAVAEMEANTPVQEPARSKAAERQRRYRERNKASQNVTDVTPDITGDDNRHADPLPLSPNENKSNPHTPAPENNSRVREADEPFDAHVADWKAWRERNPYPRPHWAPPPLWADWLKNRKAKKRPNTASAHDRLLRDVAALSARTGWPPGAIFQACVEQGWVGIYETDEMKAVANGNRNEGNRGRSPRNSGQRDNRDGFKRACDDWIDEAERSAVGGNGAGGQLALGGPDAL